MTPIIRLLPLLLALVGTTVSAADGATSLLGAWQRSDGRLFTLAPSAEDTWRFRLPDDGRSGRLHPVGDGRWQAGPGFSDLEPAAVTITERGADRLDWQEADGQRWQASRLPLTERDFSVDVDDIRIAARLVTPVGDGPFPLVMLVHGSERTPAIGTWHDPYLLAANGIASVVYDKRGTGQSQGEFTMDFQRLAADAVAVTRIAEVQPEIDRNRVGYAGYSQGGWVAPLAAAKHGKARAVLVGYGSIDSPLHEDGWQCREALRAIVGNDPQALTTMDAWVNATHVVLNSNLQEGWDDYRSTLEQVESQPWFERIDEERCIGISFAPYPAWILRLFAGSRLPPQLDWDYDSRALLASFDLPMLWQLAADDEEAPAADTAAAVRSLQQSGKPYQLRVYPDTDHGILTFRIQDGERVITGFHPDYYRDMLAFWKTQFEVGSTSLP